MVKPHAAKKKPPKEVFQLKEIPKIENEVFDRRTLLFLSKVMKKEIISYLDYIISTGKEANVFKAVTPSGVDVAVKVYKIETTHFVKKQDYILGDPRFEKIKLNEKELVFSFVRKEFKNLEKCFSFGVSVPKPIFHIGNIIVMEFLGDKGLPFPLLLDSVCTEKLAYNILENMRKMFRANLVHADLSEYNILVGYNDKPYFIDFGQAVVFSHPKANEYFERDVRNIVNFLNKRGIKINYSEAYDYITS